METLITTYDKTKKVLSCPDGKLSHRPNYIFVKANSNKNGFIWRVSIFFLSPKNTHWSYFQRAYIYVRFFGHKRHIRKLCYINIYVVSVDRAQVTLQTAYYYCKCCCSNYQHSFETISYKNTHSRLTNYTT